VSILADLPAQQKARLSDFLLANGDIFAWSASDMPGVDPKLVMHSLDVDDRRGVFQKKRVLRLERQLSTKEAVNKLLAAGFIRGTKYPTWLSNVVLVPKHNGK